MFTNIVTERIIIITSDLVEDEPNLWIRQEDDLLSFVAAGTTVIAGILHLTMAPGSISRDPGQGILFLVGGTVQVFWAVPVIKRWGRIWQIIGIVGTTVFVILYYSSRLHLLPEGNILGGGPPDNSHPGGFPRGNMPRGIGFGLNGNALLIEACQIAFIGLYAVQSKVISMRQKKTDNSCDMGSSKKTC